MWLTLSTIIYRALVLCEDTPISRPIYPIKEHYPQTNPELILSDYAYRRGFHTRPTYSAIHLGLHIRKDYLKDPTIVPYTGLCSAYRREKPSRLA